MTYEMLLVIRPYKVLSVITDLAKRLQRSPHLRPAAADVGAPCARRSRAPCLARVSLAVDVCRDQGSLNGISFIDMITPKRT